MADRMSKLSDKIRETEPFGVTQYSKAEFRKKAMTDEAFRTTLSERMGPGNFLDLMEQDDASTA